MSHVNEQPMKVIQKAGFYKKLGEENFCAHIDDALARAQEIVKA
jgi:SulP family sulfate permease